MTGRPVGTRQPLMTRRRFGDAATFGDAVTFGDPARGVTRRGGTWRGGRHGAAATRRPLVTRSWVTVGNVQISSAHA